MSTGYLMVNGIKVTRREYNAFEKKELGLKLDHFDILALQRYNEKMKGQHEKK